MHVWADVLRYVVIAEVLMAIGFFAQRIWRRQHKLTQYLSMMVIALLCYSFFTLFFVISRMGKPLWWDGWFITAAATIAFVAIVRGK